MFWVFPSFRGPAAVPHCHRLNLSTKQVKGASRSVTCVTGAIKGRLVPLDKDRVDERVQIALADVDVVLPFTRRGNAEADDIPCDGTVHSGIRWFFI